MVSGRGMRGKEKLAKNQEKREEKVKNLEEKQEDQGEKIV